MVELVFHSDISLRFHLLNAFSAALISLSLAPRCLGFRLEMNQSHTEMLIMRISSIHNQWAWLYGSRLIEHTQDDA